MWKGNLVFSGEQGAKNLSSLSKEELVQLVQAGMIYRDAHRFAEAREIFIALREALPGNATGEIGLGTICFSEGCFAEAANHYRQALKLDPRSAYAYALLGESQIFQGQYASASLSLRRAGEIDPKGSYGRLAENLLKFVDCLPAQESEL